MTYAEILKKRMEMTGSGLCVGIDPRLDRHESAAAIQAFCEKVIDETAEFAAAFKPNIAYFEALGVRGYEMVETLIGRIKASGVPVILDAKRGDIGTTQEHYAKAYFANWDVDAVTLSPYMGFDSVEPFLQYTGKGVYLLGVTSNPGAADLQMHGLADGRRVFELVGEMTRHVSTTPAGEGGVGLVLGLTNVSADILARMPDVPLLIPGLGAQGGDLEVLRGSGRLAPSVINVSRGILYAEDHLSFSEKAKNYAHQIASLA